ncbi:30882_t:CDS:2, partial [Racocetra persica]
MTRIWEKKYYGNIEYIAHWDSEVRNNSHNRLQSQNKDVFYSDTHEEGCWPESDIFRYHLRNGSNDRLISTYVQQEWSLYHTDYHHKLCINAVSNYKFDDGFISLDELIEETINYNFK